MKFRKLLLAALLPILTAGCQTASSPEMQAKQARFYETIPVCKGEADCKAKWEYAQIWVVKNAGYKLQTISDVLIQTYNPSRDGVTLAMQVLKEPIGGGAYKIVIDAYCNNMFGCMPKPIDAKLSFNDAIGKIQNTAQ